MLSVECKISASQFLAIGIFVSEIWTQELQPPHDDFCSSNTPDVLTPCMQHTAGPPLSQFLQSPPPQLTASSSMADAGL